MWKRIKGAWSAYRHAAALKGLLETLGAWKWIALAAAVVMGAAVNVFLLLPLWARILVGLAAAALTLAVAGFGVTLWRLFGQSESSGLYRIEVEGMNSKNSPYHDELLEAYIREHPDPNEASQIRSNSMSRELAEKVATWLQPRLKGMGFSGELKLVDFVIRPPAGIRMLHAEGVQVSGNDVEVDPGISGIDAEHFKNSQVKDNKVRVVSAPSYPQVEKIASAPTVAVRTFKEGIVVAVRQTQEHQKAIPAHVTVIDVRRLVDGKLITTKEFHSNEGIFSYHAIQLHRVGNEASLHYGEEAVWWLVASRDGKFYLPMFWPDRPSRQQYLLSQAVYVASLELSIGKQRVNFQAAWEIDVEHKLTISAIDHTEN